MRIILLPLMIGHALGDFYFQTDKMALHKTEGVRSLLFHALVYAGAMAGVLTVCL